MYGRDDRILDEYDSDIETEWPHLFGLRRAAWQQSFPTLTHLKIVVDFISHDPGCLGVGLSAVVAETSMARIDVKPRKLEVEILGSDCPEGALCGGCCVDRVTKAVTGLVRFREEAVGSED